LSVDQQPTRGRPPGPSLSEEAVHVFRRNAFAALRGPNSRGAVPRSAFNRVDVSTVDRSVKREFSGAADRTPFDLASHHLSRSDGFFRTTLQHVFEAVEESFRQTDQMETTLRVFLKANYLTGCADEGYLAAFTIQFAACAHLESGNDELPKQSVAAAEVVEMRRQLISDETDGFIAGLAIALRRLRRRPRAHYTLRDVVLAVTAASDGSTMLHKLQPDLLEDDLVVDMLWSVIWGLTEPGLLDPPSELNPEERQLVEAALEAFSEGRLPSADQLSRHCGVPVDAIEALFPTDEALAQRCMDYAVGSSVETESIAVNVRGAELAAIRDLLIATTEQASSTPLLIEMLRRDKDSGFCAEARRHIAEALGQSAVVALDYGTADGVALMLVDAALQGRVGKPIWEAGLDAFAIKD
jgi:hypothetical protein